MRANLEDVPALVQETRECALHYAMSIEIAEKSELRSLWDHVAEIAMDVKGAALMTIASTLMASYPQFKAEHAASGYIDLNENAPGPPLRTHDCRTCEPLQVIARSLDEGLARIWGRPTAEAPDIHADDQRLRADHMGLLGLLHLALASILVTDAR